jgi:hypothetical protein
VCVTACDPRYSFPGAKAESVRPARVTRIGVVQHGIVLPTTAPVMDQYRAIEARVGKIIDAAGKAGVQVRGAANSAYLFFICSIRLPHNVEHGLIKKKML